MREFQDEEDRTWIATVEEREGKDHKGRFFFVARPEGVGESEKVELIDVRWNSRKSAERTLRTMSPVELRRRLRQARGRARTHVPA